MELSTALFLPLLLLDVVFFQEGLGLKCWHTGLIILEAIESPFFLFDIAFWLRPAQNDKVALNS